MRNIGSKGTTPIDYRLYDALPNGSNSPTVLRSGTVNASLAGNSASSEWIDFLFTPHDVTPGTTLFLAVSGPSAGFQVYDFFSTGGVAYAAGDAYLTNGPNNNLNPGMDLTFRTYPTLAQPVATPEPASLTLLATGLIGIAGAVRGRARQRA
jgi:hypothetical protein